MSPGRRALVLGGGGLAGIAWHTGVLAACADAGLDLSAAELVLGTSAGATVAAQIGSGIPAEEWYQRQVDVARQNEELEPTGLSMDELWETMIRVAEEFPDPVERRRRIGTLALTTATIPEPARRAVVAGRLPPGGWPAQRIGIVVVDAVTGERRVLDAGSGVDLVDAVTASSAVPGVWPPVTIGSSRYIDGGVDSLTNADLAVGYQRVLVLAPMADPVLDAQVDAIEVDGRAMVVTPDEAALAAFGTEPLAPSVRAPAARAGFTQGTGLAPAVVAFWGS